MDARCDGDVCKELKTQTAEESMKCTVPQVVKEDIDGCKLNQRSALTRPSHDLTNNVAGLTTLPGDRMLF